MAIAVALVAAPVLVPATSGTSRGWSTSATSAAQVGVAVVFAAAAVTALCWLFRRYPQAFPIAAVAVLPLRVPLEIGGETANLLVPLYVVIAAGVIASALRPAPARRDPAGDPWPRRLRWLLAATLVLYAIQASYSVDVSNAIENIGFFLVPFAVLFCLLAEVEWTRQLLRRTLIAVGAVDRRLRAGRDLPVLGRATSSSTPSSSTRTSSTSTSGSTRSSSTRTSSAATWRWR